METGEFGQAKKSTDELEGMTDSFAVEIRSVFHDGRSCGHGRDYRGIVLFFKELIIRNNTTVSVFDLRNRHGGGYILTVNVFACRERISM